MGLLDNVDEQLNNIKTVSNSLKMFKKLKVRNIKNITTNKRKFKSQKHVKLGHNYYKKIKKVKNLRKERDRCPREYKLYIVSKWWTKRKNEYYQNHSRICAACNSTEFIVLHHIIYGHYGKEKDTDLIPLCSHCHHEFHKIYLLKRNMQKSTQNFIYNKRKDL